MVVRDSNIELLRLVAMFLIVLHHCSTWGTFREVYDFNAVSAEAAVSHFLNGFLFVGVNVFILISGYCGIKFKLRGLVNLYLTCCLYGLCGYLLQVQTGEIVFGKEILYRSLLVFSHCPWWFIGAYIGLYFIAPILNKAVEGMSKRQLQCVLLLFTVMNVWFGYFYHYDMFNVGGYNVEQMVYIYLIGRYIRLYVRLDNATRKQRLRYMALYLTCAVIWGVVSVWQHFRPIPHWESFSYNNPFVISGAVGLFCFAASFTFQSRWVNRLAKGMIGVYLIHSLPVVQPFLFGTLQKIFTWLHVHLVSLPWLIVSEWAVLITAVLVVMAGCCCIDAVRRIVVSPLLNWAKKGDTCLKKYLFE